MSFDLYRQIAKLTTAQKYTARDIGEIKESIALLHEKLDRLDDKYVTRTEFRTASSILGLFITVVGAIAAWLGIRV